MSEKPDISGYWSGWYSYGLDIGNTNIPFSAFVEAAGTGLFIGTVMEPNTFASPALVELTADISGEISRETVYFDKVYHPGPDVHQEVIKYLGNLNEDGTLISGEWHAGQGMSFTGGKFQMERSSGLESEALSASLKIDRPDS
ncbi:hypothetical protein [Ponticaulis sp.]|uniref:hypothetical protein n=1 Tax=Ponticaulis sp. TaxID=2020902 RepID=UPI000B6CA01F|nr:hypothetical protein [Ponticaulis sp.]MAI90522.1 hypothetical protein [Ponticaulis sp.]OUY00216.1 MAG: hypothetical protein CBB65_08795 [Hyphomonadaceae bacterium TMED5]|tara:strand:- start:149952 stop:150380 length:429 start_codon:yes stop_codon:yes gene_type:complete